MPRATKIVATLGPSSSHPDILEAMIRAGVNVVRLNFSHGTAQDHTDRADMVRAAAQRAGTVVAIMADLQGPKIRVGKFAQGKVQLENGAPFVLDAARTEPGDNDGVGLDYKELPRDVKPGDVLLLNDGLIVLKVDGVRGAAVHTTVVMGGELSNNKGINKQGGGLTAPALTAKDREDLAFVAAHADGIEFSFVQSPADVLLLQASLAEIRPADWREIALILKIETAEAVHNLPDIIVAVGRCQPVAIMIARGDLAIEIGFSRMAEMQEEILWIAEAAQVPVIWATQVLEHMVKEGMPNRGELTDAAMAARAECVMLNKGPYLFEAIDALELLLARMGNHMHKKTPQLRQLTSW